MKYMSYVEKFANGAEKGGERVFVMPISSNK